MRDDSRGGEMSHARAETNDAMKLLLCCISYNKTNAIEPLIIDKYIAAKINIQYRENLSSK